jgi:lipoprotein-releasing system permease protein
MKGRWILFVAARHFRTKRREKGHTAAILSVLGIAAGVMTLTAVLAVMNGFQLGTIENILEVGSYHLQVSSDDPPLRAEEIGKLPGVRTAVPYHDLFGLASGYFRDPAAIVIRSVPETILTLDARFASNLQTPSGSFDLYPSGSVVIGEQLARRLGLRVGDEMQVVGFAGGEGGFGSTTATLQVSGLFTSGFLEYDGGWAYVSIETGREVLGLSDGGTVGVKLTDRFADRQMAERIRELAPGAEISSWREYNRAIFGALRLEKTLMMVLVGLIFVVVALNIYQSLRRSVAERTEEIAVLKALGASPVSLQGVFVFEGLLIGLAGAISGVLLGVLISLNVNELFSFAEYLINLASGSIRWVVAVLSGADPQSAGAAFSVFSPAYFYIERIPATLIPFEVIGVFLFALGSATVAAYAASRRVSRIMPAQVLRYE